MLEPEDLEYMIPKMVIEYRIKKECYTYGKFEEVPKKALGAYIYTKFPVVRADGKFTINIHSFTLYVGEVINADKVLKDENTKYSKTVINKIKKHKEYGETKLVINKFGVYPIGLEDKVFATNEEMADAIKKINDTFKSVRFTIENVEY